MKPMKSWNEWIKELRRTRGIDLAALGARLLLLCFVNGVKTVLTLREAYERFCQVEFRFVLPIDQFSYAVKQFSEAFPATDVAGASGCNFGCVLMKSRLALTHSRYQITFPATGVAAFHSNARRFRSLMLRLPPQLHLFRSYRIPEGREAGQQGYRLRQQRSCLLIVGAAPGTAEMDIPWEVFALEVSDPSEIEGARKKLARQRRERARRRRARARRCSQSRMRAPGSGTDGRKKEPTKRSYADHDDSFDDDFGDELDDNLDEELDGTRDDDRDDDQ